MADNKEVSVLKQNLEVLATPDGIQKYILGTKKSGYPRAVYDVVKDFTVKKHKKHDKHKKSKKKSSDSIYDFYRRTKKKDKKKKHKKNSLEVWHF